MQNQNLKPQKSKIQKIKCWVFMDSFQKKTQGLKGKGTVPFFTLEITSLICWFDTLGACAERSSACSVASGL